MHRLVRPVSPAIFRGPARNRLRSLLVESLEDRFLLNCDYSALANDLKDQINTLQVDIKQAITIGQSLPVIGDRIGEAGQFLDNLADTLGGALGNLEDDVLEPTIQQALFAVLHGGPLDILADHNGDGSVDPSDVEVQINNDGANCSVEIGMHLTRNLVSFDLGVDASFDLGLPALPFQISTKGGIEASLGFDWPDFRFTLDSNAGVILDLSPQTDLSLQVVAGLQPDSELTANIGFLHATVTDGVQLEDDGDIEQLNTQFVASVAIGLGFGQDGSFLVEAEFDTQANVALHIDALIDQDFPSIAADFVMHWDGFEEDAEAPVVALRNITVDVGGYLSDILSPIVDAIQKVAEPINPFVDFVTEPIPVLSDLANAVGLGDVTLLSLSEVADDYLPSSGYTELVDIIQLVVQVVDVANQFEDPAAPSLKFNVGDLLLSNEANGDLRDKPAAKDITDVTAKDLTDLVANPANVHNLIDSVNDLDVPVEVKQPIIDLLNRFSSGVYYEFPILDNPLGEIGNLLLGKDSTLFSFTAAAKIDGDAELKYPISLGIDVVIQGNYSFDAAVTIGYDTFGLRKFIVDGINNNGGFDGLDLLDGLFIDADSHVYLDGGFAAGASAEYLVVEAEVTGGVSGGLHLSMPDESDLVSPDGFADNDPQKIRPFSELSHCLFAADGVLTAGLYAKIRVGTDLIGVEEKFTIGEVEIASFDVDCVPNPFAPPLDPNLAYLDTNTGVLTLHVGSKGSLRANYDPNDPTQADEQYRITVGVPFADEKGNLPAGDLLTVSAFGMTQRFTGVKSILADAGDGNDKIRILASENSELYPLTADVDIRGGAGNDLLIYEGTGQALLRGDSGDDKLFGGAGQNTLLGGDGNDVLEVAGTNNLLNGGAGDDVLTGGPGYNALGAVFYQGIILNESGNDYLVGGQGNNFMRGGAGDDTLLAGPGTDDLDGEAGNDHLSAGSGRAMLVGNRGDDYITWNVGDGIPLLIDGGGVGEANTLGLVGTDADELLLLGKDSSSNALKIAGLTSSPFLATHMQIVAFEGLAGAEQILVEPLTGTDAQQVGLNLGDVLKGKNALGDAVVDKIVVQGSQSADTLFVSKELAVLKPEQPAVPPSTERTPAILGGITKVVGMPNYVVRLANVEDDLLVTSRNGDDTIVVQSITGPTQIHAGSGNDTLVVQAADPGVLNDPVKLPDYPVELNVDGGQGNNRLSIDQSSSLIPLSNTFQSQHFISDLLELNFTATGGNLKGGVELITGQYNDSVTILDTLSKVPMSLDTRAGSDVVRLGASADLAPNGNLNSIQGPLSIETGQGENALVLYDRTDLSGNQHVAITSNQILGMVGPVDNVPLDYQATQGQLVLGVFGSNFGKDNFQILYPTAHTSILSGAGDDQVKLVGSDFIVAVAGEDGDDLLEVGATVNSLNGINAGVLFFGGSGQDTLNVNDKSTTTDQVFALGQDSIQRLGGGAIKFDNTLEQLGLSQGSGDDRLEIAALPLSLLSLVAIGNSGSDRLTGPDSNSLFVIDSNNAGVVNGQLQFSSFESLQGGNGNDIFRFQGSGKLSSALVGAGGFDQLDYSQLNSNIAVNWQTHSATRVPIFSSIESLVGSSGQTVIIGPNLPTQWSVSDVDAGVMNTLAEGPIQFAAVGFLTGGTSVDVFSIGQSGQLSGRILDQGGMADRVEYTQLTEAVQVNLSSGQASRVSKGIIGIEQIYGGSNNDILIGSDANNVLLGMDGNDVIVGLGGDDILDGGAGQDILIGGLGVDLLQGGGGDDLIIANRTTYDTNLTALQAFGSEWTNAALTYEARVDRIRTGVGPNGTYRLNTSTVFDDAAVDTVFGQDDRDWIFATLSGASVDQLLDLAANEFVN
ncbi:MAG: hypothetical protein KDB22_03370 [Planctomycetales bacterium]|nr:hypothetical protein [Planctomycetales bacterium]